MNKDKWVWLVIGVVLISAFVNGQTSTKSYANDSSQEEKIKSLENKVSYLEKTSSQLLNIIPSENAYFTPASKGFLPISYNGFTFLVKLENLTPYANGYKAKFKIYNPYVAYFDNVHYLVRWGEGYDFTGRNQIDSTEKLLPGTWNYITIVLSPATAKETGTIGFSLSFSAVQAFG